MRKKYRFGGRFWRPAYLKNPGDPSGSPGFFYALSIQNRWAVSLPRIILRGISLRESGQTAGPPHRGGPCSHPANIICRGPTHNRRVLATHHFARHFAARNRTSGWPAALRRALFAPGKFHVPGPCSQPPPLPRRMRRGVSLRETEGRLRGRLLAGVRRHFVNETAEPFVVVKGI